MTMYLLHVRCRWIIQIQRLMYINKMSFTHNIIIWKLASKLAHSHAAIFLFSWRELFASSTILTFLVEFEVNFQLKIDTNIIYQSTSSLPTSVCSLLLLSCTRRAGCARVASHSNGVGCCLTPIAGTTILAPYHLVPAAHLEIGHL